MMFRGTCRFHLQVRRISRARNQREIGWKAELCSAYSSTLKIKATFSSETSVYFQRTTQHYISEDRTLQDVLYRQILVEFPSNKFHENPFSCFPIVSCRQMEATQGFEAPKNVKPLSWGWIHRHYISLPEANVNKLVLMSLGVCLGLLLYQCLLAPVVSRGIDWKGSQTILYQRTLISIHLRNLHQVLLLSTGYGLKHKWYGSFVFTNISYHMLQLM
jgi:hypothetical protein